MCDSQSPEQQLQSILKNILVGGNMTLGNITQEQNTIKIDSFIVNLTTSDNNLGSFNQETVDENLFSLVADISIVLVELAQINNESIQKAYEIALSETEDTDIWNLSENNIAEMLIKLHEFRVLPNFFDQLTQDADISEELREKIKHFTKKLPQKKPQEDKIDKPPNNCPQHLESFVLFTLNSTDNKDRFLLNAWLIKDNSVEGIAKYQSLLNDGEPQSGILCKLSEIQNKIDFFIKKARKILRDRRYNLILEFFLPSHLMLMEIDLWKISSSIVDEITLGTEYPIRLRSIDRLKTNYRDEKWSQWCDRWDKVNAVLDESSVFVDFEHLPAMDNFSWKSLKINLRNKIGLKVTCPPPKSKLEELFRAILMAATPIAIWTRRDLTTCGCLTSIDDFLSRELLSNLCESVRMLREEADADPEEHFGSHLAILWEDPYRLTPDVMVELTPPEL